MMLETKQRFRVLFIVVFKKIILLLILHHYTKNTKQQDTKKATHKDELLFFRSLVREVLFSNTKILDDNSISFDIYSYKVVQ